MPATTNKICKTCKQNLPITEFRKRKKWNSYECHCNQCLLAKRRDYAKQEYERNRQRRLDQKKEYWAKNKSKISPKRTIYMRERLQNDIEFRLCHNMRGRLSHAVKQGQKSAGTAELVGCDLKSLRKHLESKFTPQMNWDNYGSYWHIDHIRPCASFDLTDPEQQRICFHWTNLQPLEAKENIRKGARLDWTKDKKINEN